MNKNKKMGNMKIKKEMEKNKKNKKKMQKFVNKKMMKESWSS